MEIRIKDRKDEVEMLRMSLAMAELHIDYPCADLILKVQERLKKLKGNYSLNDGIEVHHKWKDKWDYYFLNLKKENL